ncbi:MAG: hypothetical protein RMX68_028660 [Aulosira sp. ZfuVER01]|nr:hypothetical protein [Aulosira sp. DedVER01a]
MPEANAPLIVDYASLPLRCATTLLHLNSLVNQGKIIAIALFEAIAVMLISN